MYNLIQVRFVFLVVVQMHRLTSENKLFKTLPPAVPSRHECFMTFTLIVPSYSNAENSNPHLSGPSKVCLFKLLSRHY